MKSGLAGANTPFADFLAEQRSRAPARVRIEHTSAFKRRTHKCHIDTQWHARTELDREAAVIKQRDDGPLLAAVVRNPARARGPPDRKHSSAHVIAAER